MLKSIKNLSHVTEGQVLPYLPPTSFKSKPSLKNYNSLVPGMIKYTQTLYLGYIGA